MIRSVGYTQDGGIWMSIAADVDKADVMKADTDSVSLTVLIPMDATNGKKLLKLLKKALKDGQKWLNTGVDPNNGNGQAKTVDA